MSRASLVGRAPIRKFEMSPETPPEVCTCSALRQAARHLTRLYDEALAPVGVGLNQYAILAKLDRQADLSIQGLAALLVMDRSTLGHLLRPLERRGLLSIRASKSDGRRRVLSLSPAGAALLSAARPLWREVEQRFQERFGDEAAADLRATMRTVTVVDLRDEAVRTPTG